MELVPWRDAWQDALYGPDGFYRRPEGPAGHFTTSTHGPLGGLLAEALGRLADAEGATHVVDVGAGRGELLRALHGVRPDLRLTGVDVVDRPEALPAAVGWMTSPGGAGLPDDLHDLDDVLAVAHEWLDVVPCSVLEVDDGGVARGVLVDAAARVESVSGPVEPDDAAWCAAHWPLEGLPAGTRVEVGLSRDRAWADLLSRIRSGTALAVDYGHTREDRPPSGTLVGFRDGVAVPALPDGTCDLTAHVAVDSLEQDERRTQREALHALGLSAAAPDHVRARTDPAGYLADLARSSAVRALTDEDGLGGFWWVLRRVRTRPSRARAAD
ncbi:SAM-dependent methyltransferase [Phycicoccus avicenniae]|uniref:SAM-dependent methyltransferase n=1 Tax=Phycicoccus avicenniae TaxID=2828860 RepID=UPI003D2AB913